MEQRRGNALVWVNGYMERCLVDRSPQFRSGCGQSSLAICVAFVANRECGGPQRRLAQLGRPKSFCDAVALAVRMAACWWVGIRRFVPGRRCAQNLRDFRTKQIGLE